MSVLEAAVKLVDMGSYRTAADVRAVAKLVVSGLRHWSTAIAALRGVHPVKPRHGTTPASSSTMPACMHSLNLSLFDTTADVNIMT